MNGDGHADLVSSRSPHRQQSASASAGPGVDRAAPRRFRITNIGDCPRSAGDVDGDGRDDLIVDGPDGAAAVVFGSSRPAVTIHEEAGQERLPDRGEEQPLHREVRPGRRHQRRPSRRPGDRLGPEGQAYPRPLRHASCRRDRSWQTGAPRDHWLAALRGTITSAGDVNGDGIDDLLVGDRRGDPRVGAALGGRACVIFGKRGRWPARSSLRWPRRHRDRRRSQDLRLRRQWARPAISTGTGTATCGSQRPRSEFRGRASAAAPCTSSTAARPPGASMSPVTRVSCGSRPLRSFGDMLGFSVAVAGDVTGDRRADLVVGGYYSGKAWSSRFQRRDRAVSIVGARVEVRRSFRTRGRQRCLGTGAGR